MWTYDNELTIDRDTGGKYRGYLYDPCDGENPARAYIKTDDGNISEYCLYETPWGDKLGAQYDIYEHTCGRCGKPMHWSCSITDVTDVIGWIDCFGNSSCDDDYPHHPSNYDGLFVKVAHKVRSEFIVNGSDAVYVRADVNDPTKGVRVYSLKHCGNAAAVVYPSGAVAMRVPYDAYNEDVTTTDSVVRALTSVCPTRWNVEVGSSRWPYVTNGIHSLNLHRDDWLVVHPEGVTGRLYATEADLAASQT